jgi:CheY-like chemotaxis protein
MPDIDALKRACTLSKLADVNSSLIMMLSVLEDSTYIADCQELGVRIFLKKPIGPSQLLDSVQQALGGLEIQQDNDPDVVVPRRHTPPSGLYILLAEDNPLNQMVATGLLKNQGHRIALAPNGLKALEVYEKESFDLILMDVQMPEMDGLEATARIRKKEKQSGRRVPIIALTAHAMQGDRERFLAAGMDDYVTKPIQLDNLLEIIERLTKERA